MARYDYVQEGRARYGKVGLGMGRRGKVRKGINGKDGSLSGMGSWSLS